MPDTNLLYLFRLMANRPRKLRLLLEQFGGPDAVWESANDEELRVFDLDRTILDRARAELQSEVDADIEWLRKKDHHMLTLDDAEYPSPLREIYDPPVVLFAKGSIETLSLPSIAMVGSRNPTRSGLNNAHRLAAELAKSGLVVVSGMALGIDAASHQGALADHGYTVAVLGTGCDQVYPARHHKLAERIRDHGALISEFPLRWYAAPGNFPRRNRVVTGLSLGTVVVEATPRSGTLISARYCMEQGREVFAIPGNISNQQSRGCHQLIRDGATLVESVDDILSQLSFAADRAPVVKTSPNLTAFQQEVFESLDTEPMRVDQIVELLGVTVGEVMSTLVELEIFGLVGQDKGGFIRS